MKKDLFGKLTAFRSIILFFLVMLTGLVANAGGTTGKTKVKPYVFISKTGYGADGEPATYLNDTKFIEPAVVVYENDKKQTAITNRFYISYYLAGEDGKPYPEEVIKGKTWSVDPNTGTRISTRYGDVETGSKAGVVYVHVKATPSDRYTDDFETAEGVYRITLNMVSADAPIRIVPEFVTNETYKNGWYAATGTIISLPKFKVQYTTTDSRDKNKELVIDITDRFKVTATVDPETSSLATVDNIYKYNSLEKGNESLTTSVIKTNTTAGTAKVKFSFEPITAGAYNPISDFTLDLNIIDEKVTPQLIYSADKVLAYTAMQDLSVQRPTVYDQFGNDLTPSVSYTDGNKPLWIAWSTAPLAEGKKIHTPQTYLSAVMQEWGFQPLPDDIIRFGNGITMYDPDHLNTGDLVFLKNVRRNEFVECNTAWYDAAKQTCKVGSFTSKIYCQVYPNLYNEDAKARYNANENSYEFEVKPRPVKLELTPDPSTVNITKDTEITMQNRFKVRGHHVAEIDDNKFGRKAGEDCYLEHNSISQEFGCEYTIKFKRGEAKINNYPHDDESKHIVVDKDGNRIANPDSYNGEMWDIYWSVMGYNTDSDWTLTFLKDGPVQVTYSMYPYNIGYFEDGSATSTISETFNVEDKITPVVKVTPDPIILYTTDKVFPSQPKTSVTDAFGNDIKEHYDLTFDEEELAKFGVGIDENGDFKIIGNLVKGDYVDIKVKATPKEGETKYKEGETTFRIVIKDLGNSQRFAWAVYNEDKFGGSIGTGKDNIPADDTKHGKLVFTGAGNVSGGYSIDAIPGLTVQFGKLAEAVNVKPAEGSTESSATDEDPWIAKMSGEEDGNKIVVYGDPVVIDEKTGLPVDGTFYVLTPRTNGFLTLDAKFKANNEIVLTDAKGKEKQSIITTTDTKKELRFRYPIYAGTVYYMYNSGDATSYEPLKVHGISFEPAFINQRNDMNAIVQATAYANGFAGALPALTSASKNVDKYVVYGIAGEPTDKNTFSLDDFANINKDNGMVTTLTKGTVGMFKAGTKKISNYSEMELKAEHMKVYAEVTSAYKNGGNNVKMVPAYNLYIGDIPTYVMKNGYTPNVLERISTTNYPTHIRAFFGGWENAEDRPYIKNNKINETDPDKIEVLVDSWKTSKMDSVGSNDRVIDNFAFASFGTQNASSETVNGTFVYDEKNEDQTYNVPCRGTYVQFEPNESGTIAVYIIQNGMVAYDGDPDNASKSGMNKLKLNPVFITDETGTPVELAKWTHSQEGANTDKYTEAVIRCSYADILKDCGGLDEKSDATAKELLTKVGYITENGENPKIKKGQAQTVLDIAAELDPNAIPGSKGYSVITKAYTRYSFRVKAGKSYFLFMNGSKLGNDGFAFMPEGWAPTRENTEPSVVTLDEKGTGEGSKDEFLGKEDTFDKYDKTVNVKLYHTFKANQWTALSLPFSVNDSQIRKVFGDDAWVISLDQITDKATVNNVEYQNVAQFLQHNYHWIVAGRPYFIRPGKDFKQTFDEDENGRQYIKLDSVTFERNTYTDANKYDTGSGYIQAKTLTQNNKEVFNFKAIYAPTKIAAGDYFIGSTTGGEAKLYRATKDTNLSGYRAYIDNKGKANGARIGSFGFGDFDEEGNKETTGIDEVYEFYDNGMGKKIAGKKGVFSVDGVKVAENAADIDRLPAGVYIVNGQTVVK